VRLFEAAACGIPIISDCWEGIDELFVPDKEIILADSADRVVQVLESADSDALAIGAAARARVLATHSAAHRAAELETYICSKLPERQRRRCRQLR